MRLDGDAFSAWLRNYKRSAWRLETRQVYAIPREHDYLPRFLAGEPMPPNHNAAWHKVVSDNIVAGKMMQRVKIVRRPLTDYTRCLLEWGLPGNIAAGEDYRILDLTDRENPGLPDQDLWIFDDSTVVLQNFDESNSLVSIEQVESSDIDQYLKWRELAVKESVPFGEWDAET